MTNLEQFCARLLMGMMLVMVAGALSACETLHRIGDDISNIDLNPGADPNENAMVAANDPVALRLAESADKAAAALQDLARVEQTRRPPAPEPADVPATDELNAPITIDWVGGAEELVRNIAGRLKYDVVVVGSVPPVPVVVQIHQRDRSTVEALRNIGDQATQYLDLIVDSPAHKIEIHYKIPEPTQS